MTKDIENKILELKELLYSSEEFKEYFSVVKQIQNNEEIQKIIENRKYFQQIDVQNHGNDQYAHEQYLLYCKKYNEHPLIQNYNQIKNEVTEVINYLKGELSI